VKANVSIELPAHVGILLLPGFSMLSFCGLIEPLRLANQLLGTRHYSWRVYATLHTVQASCGMCIPSDAKPDASEVPSCLFVVSGFDPWPQTDSHLKIWLRALDRRGSMLGAVDTGTFLLASAGLMDSVPAVLHWESASAFKELFPDIPISDRAYILDGRRLLCAGGAFVFDMMLALIERRHGCRLREAIADRLLLRSGEPSSAAVRPEPGRSSGDIDADVRRALVFMERYVEQRLSISDLARAVRIPRRTLERKFQLALSQSPSQYYQTLRLKHARALLRHCDLTVQEVAIASGFTSLAHFCRVYKAHFSVNASKDRRLDYTLVK
jgi:AraC family carnitine catabolism transcriptional activator